MFTHGADVHRQSGCFEAKYKEMRVACDFLHSAVIYLYKPFVYKTEVRIRHK